MSNERIDRLLASIAALEAQRLTAMETVRDLQVRLEAERETLAQLERAAHVAAEVRKG